MHNQYHGRFEKEYWVRRIYTLIQNINDLSGSNIDLKSEINICKFRDEDYCIVTYFYYSKLYCRHELYRAHKQNCYGQS